MALKETYLAKLKRMREEYPDAEFIVVTRTARSVLAPSRELLADFKEFYDSLLVEGVEDIDAHNRAWYAVDYERRFREEILGRPAAMDELRRTKEMAKVKDVYLVCYEKPPKKCHRLVLMDIIREMNGSYAMVEGDRTKGVLRRAGYGKGEHPQEITMEEIKKLVDEVPDVNDPAKINYWVAKDGILIYLEGWSDACLAGTGFPLMTEGGHESKIAYIKDLTPDILKKKAEEKDLRLIKGGFIETESATNLYGVTYGVYRKHGDQTDERTRDILRRAGYGA